MAAETAAAETVAAEAVEAVAAEATDSAVAALAAATVAAGGRGKEQGLSVQGLSVRVRVRTRLKRGHNIAPRKVWPKAVTPRSCDELAEAFEHVLLWHWVAR